MEPFTPRTQTGARKKNITLSQKEYSKITGTIARTRRQNSDYSPRNVSYDEPSFIAETSFVRAPLNSRVSSTSAAPKGKSRNDSLDHLPIDIQEALILEDLLYILMGIPGNYITFHPDYSPDEEDPLQGIRFVISPSLDSSLRDLVERILPLGTYYTAISSFIEQRSHLDFGLVNHALCASIRDMLKDYQTLLSQLEHSFNTSPSFSLQKLWFYVHPTIHTLSLIYSLITDLAFADDPSASLSASSSDTSDAEEEARNEALGIPSSKLKAVLSETPLTQSSSSIPVKGGEVLAIIYEKQQSMSGDPTASMLYGTLLRAAGKPYVAMLRGWVMTGRLVDPYEELLVKESKFINRGILEMDYTDEYWERRYTLRDGSTISSGNKGHAHKAGVPAPRSAGGRLPGGACVPPLLESWKHKILLAGKYLNVIRECGIEVGRDQEREEEEFDMDDERLYTFLESTYTHANHTLLQLLLRTGELIPRLRSLKRYFFLSQSFFLTHLLDLSHNELRKTAKSASIVKLQSLLELTLNTDVQGEDTMFREDVKVIMASSGLYEWLMKIIGTGGIEGNGKVPEQEPEEYKGKDKDDKKQMLAIDALSLDYHVKFPLSLVISRKTILRYQLIFRFLLHLKHVEQSLSTMWIEQKTTPWRKPVTKLGNASSRPPSSASRSRPSSSASRPPSRPSDAPAPSIPSTLSEQSEFEKWRLRVFLLRARMLSFVQQILSFTTFEVLEPNWRLLEQKLDRVRTVDELLRDHLDFLDTCLKECMLTSAKLLKAYSKLIVTCATFALYAAPYTKSANQAMMETETAEGQRRRWEYQVKFETNFDHWFKVFLDCVQFYASSENGSLLPLVVRLTSIKKT
ncbi:gamma-tubulin complex component 2 [Dendrothele bispora CBS 962.96]|uniref:Spindle pole body component n=1 Tax=Dendrothele bispora (strain CBS 962.96) TaxID=1314807 RepID=A0A4S8LMD6_DENBC|nr:gamma-tubulin complex component 2 [Dendrothele bispora CBS 962.96]